MTRSRQTLAVAVVALLALAAGAQLFCCADERAGAARNERRGEDAALRAPAALETDDGDEAEDAPEGRAQVGEPIEPEPGPAARTPEPGPYDFAIVGVVVDRHDRPVGRAAVHLTPRGLPLQRAGRTESNGRFELRFSGARDRVEVSLEVVAGEQSGTRARTLELTAGRPFVVRLVSRRLPDPAGLTRVSQKEFEELALLPGETFDEEDGVWEELGWPNGLSAADDDAIDAGAPAVFADDFDRAACPASRRAVGRVLTAAAFLRAPVFSFELSSGDPSFHSSSWRPRGRIEGRVFDGSGAPVPRARVALLLADGAPYDERFSSDDGAFSFTELNRGHYRIEVFAGGAGRASTAIDLEKGETGHWAAHLERGLVVEGRLVDGDGAPIAKAEVCVERAGPDGLWTAVTRSEADGSFGVAGCPTGPLRLLVHRRDSQTSLFEDVRSPVFAEDRPVAAPDELREIVVDPPRPSSLAVQVVDEAGAPVIHARVRAWRVETGRGLRLPLADHAGTYRAIALPPGLYRIEVGARSHRWLDVGQFPVAGPDGLHLGAVTLDAPVALDFELRPELEGAVRAVEVWRDLDGLPVRARRVEGVPPPGFALPAGEYELEVWSALGTARQRLDLTDGARRLAHLRGRDGGLAIELLEPATSSRPRDGCTACHAGEPSR